MAPGFTNPTSDLDPGGAYPPPDQGPQVPSPDQGGPGLSRLDLFTWAPGILEPRVRVEPVQSDAHEEDDRQTTSCVLAGGCGVSGR